MEVLNLLLSKEDLREIFLFYSPTFSVDFRNLIDKNFDIIRPIVSSPTPETIFKYSKTRKKETPNRGDNIIIKQFVISSSCSFSQRVH